MANVHRMGESRSVSFDVPREKAVQMYYVNDARYATLIVVVVVGVGLTHPWCVLSVMCGARENETMQQS